MICYEDLALGAQLAKNRTIIFNKAVDLVTSIVFPKSEEERQFMMKWIFGGPRRPFCDFIFVSLY